MMTVFVTAIPNKTVALRWNEPKNGTVEKIWVLSSSDVGFRSSNFSMILTRNMLIYFRFSGSGLKNHIFWSEIGSGFWEPCSTLPHKILGSSPPHPPNKFLDPPAWLEMGGSETQRVECKTADESQIQVSLPGCWSGMRCEKSQLDKNCRHLGRADVMRLGASPPSLIFLPHSQISSSAKMAAIIIQWLFLCPIRNRQPLRLLRG